MSLFKALFIWKSCHTLDTFLQPWLALFDCVSPCAFSVLNHSECNQVFLELMSLKNFDVTFNSFTTLNVFSPIHCFMWLVLPFYKIFYTQCLQVIVMQVLMYTLNLVLPVHVTSHFSQGSTWSSYSSCASSDVHQKEFQSYIWHRIT